MQSIVLEPGAPVVDLASAVRFLRASNVAFNDEIQEALDTAHDEAEKYLQCSIREQTRRVILETFPDKPLKLPFGPVASIDQVLYKTGGSPEYELVNEGLYTLDTMNDLFARAAGASWPVLTVSAPDAVMIDYVAGFDVGGSPATVPKNIAMAIKLFTQAYYDRDNLNMTGLENAAKRLLDFDRKGMGV